MSAPRPSPGQDEWFRSAPVVTPAPEWTADVVRERVRSGLCAMCGKDARTPSLLIRDTFWGWETDAWVHRACCPLPPALLSVLEAIRGEAAPRALRPDLDKALDDIGDALCRALESLEGLRRDVDPKEMLTGAIRSLAWARASAPKAPEPGDVLTAGRSVAAKLRDSGAFGARAVDDLCDALEAARGKLARLEAERELYCDAVTAAREAFAVWTTEDPAIPGDDELVPGRRVEDAETIAEPFAGLVVAACAGKDGGR